MCNYSVELELVFVQSVEGGSCLIAAYFMCPIFDLGSVSTTIYIQVAMSTTPNFCTIETLCHCSTVQLVIHK